MTSVSTPQGPAQNAGVFKRLAAMVYDLMLIVASWMVVGGIMLALNGNEIISIPVLPLLLPIVIILFYLYFWLKTGQTLGMQTWRIRLVSARNQPLTIRQCIIRLLFATLSFSCAGLGYFWIWLDPARLAWHDRLSGTRVILVAKETRS